MSGIFGSPDPLVESVRDGPHFIYFTLGLTVSTV